MNVLCLSGPNLQLLGKREPAIYGTDTLAQIHARLVARGSELGVAVDCRQSNHEGTLVDWIGESLGVINGIVFNPGAYTHTSIALYDALRAVAVPCVEVHLSHPDAREPFRRHSRLAAACVGKVSGFGAASYVLGFEGLVALLRKNG